MKNETIAPTKEQLAHGEYKEELTSPALNAPKRYRNTSTSELDRLLFAGHLEADEHCTLQSFASDMYKSGMTFSSRSSMEPTSSTGSASHMADTLYARTRRVNDQMKELKEKLGPASANVVVNMLVADHRISPSVVPVVKKAASILLPMYGG